MLIAVEAERLERLEEQVAEILALSRGKEPDWLPIYDYAKKVGRSVATVNRWRRDGKVQTTTAGGVVLVKACD